MDTFERFQKSFAASKEDRQAVAGVADERTRHAIHQVLAMAHRATFEAVNDGNYEKARTRHAALVAAVRPDDEDTVQKKGK